MIFPERSAPKEGGLQIYPRHLVIIPDGNGRWAQKHNLPVRDGHLKGAQRIFSFADKIDKLDIGVCTFWGFSTENWSRSQDEVAGILDITRQMLGSLEKEFIDKNRRFRHVGRKDRLPPELLSSISKLEQVTADNSGKTFVLALDYGGRNEVVRAVNKTRGEQVDEESFENFLDTAGLPRPDLIIRTSGEMRTSGIYPYQAAYAEFVSSPVLFPDFDEKELERCLMEFSQRKRRFGARLGTDERRPFAWLGMEKLTLDGYVNALLPRINDASKFFIDTWRKERYYDFPSLQQDIGIYENLLAGGKKIRAGLVVFGFENFGGEPEYRDGALLAAVGYELLHNSFLVHDDIQDNSLLRRGRASVHQQYREDHEKAGGKLDHEQYGKAVAINTGNLGPVKAQEILWGINNKETRIIEANKLIARIIEMTLLGQRRDLTEVPLADLSMQHVNKIYFQKTAVYTVVGPLSLGAILAGASREQLAWVNSFGVNLGMAFQIIDDHLGLYGTEDQLGKPTGSDLAEAKKTWHFVEAWRRADEQGRSFLTKVWGNQEGSRQELEEVCKTLEDLGVKEDALERARVLAEKARGVIPHISTSPTASTILEDLIDFVINRQF